MEPAVRQRFEKIEAILRDVAEGHAAALVRMAQAETRMDRAEARMDRAELRMDRMEARMDRNHQRIGKRMHGFENLVRMGFAELRRVEKVQQQKWAGIDQKIDALVDAQLRTEASLKTLLDSLRKGGNGHQGGRPH